MKYQITERWLRSRRVCDEGFSAWIVNDGPDVITALNLIAEKRKWDWTLWLLEKVVDKLQAVSLGLFFLELAYGDYGCAEKDAVLIQDLIHYGYLYNTAATHREITTHRLKELNEELSKQFDQAFLSKAPAQRMAILGMAVHVVRLTQPAPPHSPGVAVKAVVRHFVNSRPKVDMNKTMELVTAQAIEILKRKDT